MRGSKEVRARLNSARLYLVTPARPAWGDIGSFLASVLDAGVDMVQLREKSMEAGPLLEFCEVVRDRTQRAGALFIVNDRVDVALAAGADGVHLGQEDLPLDEARRQAGEEFVIGASTHGDAELTEADRSEADYLAAGPVFTTPTKPGRPAVGLDLVRYAAKTATKPWFAIGGVTVDTLPAVLEAGARRISVVRALTEAEDPGKAAAMLRSVLDAAGEL